MLADLHELLSFGHLTKTFDFEVGEEKVLKVVLKTITPIEEADSRFEAKKVSHDEDYNEQLMLSLLSRSIVSVNDTPFELIDRTIEGSSLDRKRSTLSKLSSLALTTLWGYYCELIEKTQIKNTEEEEALIKN